MSRLRSRGSRFSRIAVAAAAAGAALAFGIAAAPGVAPAADPLPYQDPSLPTAERVADLMSRMTLAEKIGQMTQVERGDVYTDTTPITNLGYGSVLSGGGSTPD